jgi:exodeoxyribonuclease V beta subunit
MSARLTDAPEPFELTAAVPHGVTVLEASAGTGKTYTIAALATRFIADGTPLEQLLLVTFTRMATGELRERVRERLITSERELSRVLQGGAPSSDDELDWLLASGPPDVVALRAQRLADAIANFDAATIETTHGFCMEVLEELGTLGDLEPDVEIVEQVDDLVEEVIDDLYVRRFVRETKPPSMSRAEAGQIARAAIDNPTAPIHPLSPDPGSMIAMRTRLASAARELLDARKRARALITYDDMLTRLLRTLAGDHGEAAAARLRARYRVVLIDEFQDTDPIQWQIVQRAFGDGDTTLVLIADPKQAIYAFRGADVYAYLEAAKAAASRATLSINRRADERLLIGFDALFDDARLGHPEIVYRQVSAPKANQGARLKDPGSPAALRFRVVDRSGVALTDSRKWVETGAAREHIARDVAADIVGLLESSAVIEQRDEEGAVTGTDVVAPGDIAVLVPRHTAAAMVQRELELASVPAVIAGAGSVFATPAAEDWLSLLEALERPASAVRARTAAITPLIGWDAEQLATAAGHEFEWLHEQLFQWSRVLGETGVAGLAQSVLVGGRVATRLLTRIGGERRLTDLEHVAELLNRVSVREQLGMAALTGWLRARITAAGREGAHGDERTRRLDSDAASVQVLTIHRSKGLEFPVVYCPFLWEPGYIPKDGPVTFHDDSGLRGIDVSLEGSGYQAHRNRYIAEERGEDLRLAYVALTRARHRAVVWWAGSWGAKDSPLARLLFSRDAEGNIAVNGATTPSDGEVYAALVGVAERAAQRDPAAVSVEWSRLDAPRSWGGTGGPPEELSVAQFTRHLDSSWRRTSYSALTAAAHERFVGSEPETHGLQDEPAAPDGVLAGELPLAAMAAGPELGTVIHRALERVDFDADDLPAALTTALSEAAGSRGEAVLGCPIEVVAVGVASVLATPLGGDLNGLPLHHLTRANRLDELGFELPLAGGDAPTASVTVHDLAALLDKWIPSGDPLHGYALRLGDPTVAGVLRGYLNGSIDLALRVEGEGGRSRFAIVDYKTNWLAGPDEPLSAWHYRPAALAAEMQRSHYALQALLYLVALHRFLRWRVPGYDPDRDIAGVYYLFLRGMTGGDDGTGVFAWNPPLGLVAALSDLLDRGPA